MQMLDSIRDMGKSQRNQNEKPITCSASSRRSRQGCENTLQQANFGGPFANLNRTRLAKRERLSVSLRMEIRIEMLTESIEVDVRQQKFF